MKKLILLSALISPLLFGGCKHSKPVNQPQVVQHKTDSTIKIGLDIGDQAPDLAFQSPDGKTITLSSLRGKVVLLDFWASWCLPCRMENPNVVKVYELYRDKNFTEGKGFTIYSVSLDKDKKRWVEAIQQDRLDWGSHVSDLKGWESAPAAIYQINSIPANFLLNGEGIIIARNLREQALADKMKSLVL